MREDRGIMGGTEGVDDKLYVESLDIELFGVPKISKTLNSESYHNFLRRTRALHHSFSYQAWRREFLCRKRGTISGDAQNLGTE